MGRGWCGYVLIHVFGFVTYQNVMYLTDYSAVTTTLTQGRKLCHLVLGIS